jgi:hypothetical protein
MYSEVLGLAWLCMSAAVWPKSLSWANSQARVSANFECSQAGKRESAELPDQTREKIQQRASVGTQFRAKFEFDFSG